MKFATRILGAVAVVGLIATGGTAFTAAGLTSALPAQFVGGAVTNSVYGTALSSVGYVTNAGGALTAVNLGFTSQSAAEMTALIALGATTIKVTPVGAVGGPYSCATVTVADPTSTGTTVCTITPALVMDGMTGVKVTIDGAETVA